MSTDTLDPKVLTVAKVKCLRSLLFHTRYFFVKQYKRKFIVGPHHEIIAHALERVLRGECKRLIIQVAPRFGKTELAVKSFISHGLALNPSAKFIHLSYSDDLALDNSETIKDLINSEDYQLLFNVKIKHDAKAKNKWYTTEGGGVLARAAAGSVTGFGAGKVEEEGEEDFSFDSKHSFAGAIIIDDPIKPDEADSETIRERINQRFDSTIRTRTNSRNTPIIVIMQRTHPNDLAGYLQRKEEEDKWEVISLPVINEEGNKYNLIPGDALWPFKMTLEEALQKKKANDIVFERQFMLNPKPKTGLLFPIEDLNFYDPNEIDLSDPDFKYMAADPANEGGDDFSGMDSRLIGNKIYIHSVLYNTDGTDHNQAAIVKMIADHKIMYCGIEGVLGWKEVVESIREELTRKNYEGEVRLLRPRTGKHARIVTRASFIRNHFYFRKDYEDFPQYAKFIRNLTSYLRIQEPGRMNKHDDAPDNCEMIASYYQKEIGHLWPMNT